MKIFNKIIFGWLYFNTKLLLWLKKPKVVAITGSVGKTSTKNAVAEVLKGEYRVNYQKKSYNTQTGLPLSIFDLKAPNNPKNPIEWLVIFVKMVPKFFNYPYDVIVAEMGADKKGEIDYLTKMVKPNIGIVIAAHKVHTETFGTVDDILKEKSILAYRSELPIINSDEDNLVKQLLPNLNNALTYGSKKADYKIANIKRDPKTQKLNFEVIFNKQTLKINSNFVSKEGILMFAAASAVADNMGFAPAEIKAQLEDLKPTIGRMNPLNGAEDSLIIDDSYNSSPQAVISAINNIHEMGKGRKIAVLGNMNELGDYAPEAHSIVGVAASTLDLLVTIGDLAQEYIAFEAEKNGLKKDKIKSFYSPVAAGKWLKHQLKKGDIVLVKGSQNKVFSEEATKQLLANNRDSEQLVRQEDFWLNIKRKQFKDMA